MQLVKGLDIIPFKEHLEMVVIVFNTEEWLCGEEFRFQRAKLEPVS